MAYDFDYWVEKFLPDYPVKKPFPSWQPDLEVEARKVQRSAEMMSVLQKNGIVACGYSGEADLFPLLKALGAVFKDVRRGADGFGNCGMMAELPCGTHIDCHREMDTASSWTFTVLKSSGDFFKVFNPKSISGNWPYKPIVSQRNTK